MEPIIDALGQDLHDADGTRQEKLLQILSYYDKAAQADNNTTGGHSTIEEQKQFNATKAFAIIMRYGVPAGLPDSLIQLFGEQ